MDSEAGVLQREDAKELGHVEIWSLELPQTLTELYIHFLVVQAKVSNVKYKSKSNTDFHWTPERQKTLRILSKLAFEQLEKGNLIFYESDLSDCGIDLTEASVYSGVFTQMFKEERGLYQDMVFSFVHLSVQEFLAALHVHITFMNSGVNLLSGKKSFLSKLLPSKSTLIEFYRTAVDTALESPNGRLDLFLRFLLGLSLESNQSLLRGLVKPTGSSQINQETVRYLKVKLDSGLSVERNLTLLQCLMELKDRSLFEQVQTWLSSEKMPRQLSPAQWTALVSVLLSTEEPEFDLSKYQRSETALLNLMPVISKSTKAKLSNCDLSDKVCESLGSVFSSQCSLTELDLSRNPLKDSGVVLLCEGLKRPGCALKTLRLSVCGLSSRSCEALVSVLDSETNSLTELDLSINPLKDSGVVLLCEGLKRPGCALKTLRLIFCDLSDKVCESLGSVFSSQCSLTELDLSRNPLKDSGVVLLCEGLKRPGCDLKTLRLNFCVLSSRSCEALVSVLDSETNSLTELDLSINPLKDSGVVLLCEGLKRPGCALTTLRLVWCDLSDKVCESLGSVLSSQCSLTELDLSLNPLKDSGVVLLCEGLKRPGCALKTLRLNLCDLSARSCKALVSVLDSETNSLTELDLSNNNLQDSGVVLLCEGLKRPGCALTTLRLSGCDITESGCASLVSTLSSEDSCLKYLDLSCNHPGETEAKQLIDLFNRPQKKFSLEHTEEHRSLQCFNRYACNLKFDPNTVSQNIKFSNNDRTISLTKEKQSYPDHSERFDSLNQVLCSEGLKGRCYWEVEWTGDVDIAVTYKSIKRRGKGDDSCLGKNAQSWRLGCTKESFSLLHENRGRSFVVRYRSFNVYSTNRVGVYLDWEEGVLSFYGVYSDRKFHLQTYKTRFTEELCPAFGISTETSNSSVTLCDVIAPLCDAASIHQGETFRFTTQIHEKHFPIADKMEVKEEDEEVVLTKPDTFEEQASQSVLEIKHDSTARAEGESSVHSDPSCVSFKSDRSKGLPEHFKSADSTIKPSDVDSDDEFDVASVFELVEKRLHELVSSELRRFQRALSPDCFKNSSDGEDCDERKKSTEAVLDLTLHVLKEMNLEELADSLKSKVLAPMIQCQLKSKFKSKFQKVFEGIQEAGKASLLDEIYTELYLTEGGACQINEEHEATQIQMRPTRPITTLRCSDLFIQAPETQKRIRAVLTKGVAGIGKTVLTQKFSLDWAEGRNNQDLHFIFPFTFREINLLREETISLYGLIGHFFSEMNRGICRFEEFNCLFILDGLDESRLQLDFTKTPSVSDVREKTSIEILLVNLIRGTLLPSAQIWITTRPAAANQIPVSCVDMVTEIRGFTDEQKEIYFRKKFTSEEKASKVLSHLKSSQSVHSMCYIPVFSWITAKVMDHILQTEDSLLPQTLTELYIHFLVVQAKVSNVKYKSKSNTDFHWTPERQKTLMILSKLAFEQLEKGNLIFYESDLSDCGIDLTEASVYSGVFTQMFKEERGLYQHKVFSFVHLTVQEFLAALHVHITFMNSGVSLLSGKKSFLSKLLPSKSTLIEFYRTAVDTALESPNGRLDLFLRFLLGLSLESNQSLLRGLVKPTGSSQINQETVRYLKVKLDSGLSVERNLTLLQCLMELKDRSLLKQVQTWLSSEKMPRQLSPAQWTALVSVLLSTEEPEFDLSKYQRSETALLNLMPVISKSTKAKSIYDITPDGKICLARIRPTLSAFMRPTSGCELRSYSGPNVARMRPTCGMPHHSRISATLGPHAADRIPAA
ncbi:hypothetical protein WMY93_030564 [Mugilogobius chulae]|uniref:NACHT, LRR and PYD domains-containing protein 12-like n=1 Tax=Mugilogobius chulae TaxID=88201 RepID=A0AAW0MFD3_9GOBI